MSNLIIGKPLDRIDGRQKVTGAARYAAEFDLPGKVHAVSIQSTIARGTIEQIETSEAESLPGVLTVITYRNAPKLHPFPEQSAKSKPEDVQRSGNGGKGGSGQSGGSKPEEAQKRSPGKPGQKLLPLQDNQIYYSGQHIGIVVAETLEQALHAASLVRVRYASEKPVTAINLDHTFPAPDEPGREPYRTLRGDPDLGLSSASVRVEQTYITPVENHNPMEPSATTAFWQGDA